MQGKHQMWYYLFPALFLSLLLWNIPQLSFLIYPFRLFGTFVHELSHATTSVLTGGEVTKIVLDPNNSGLAYSRGGNILLVASAGYFGTLLFGTLLLFLGRYPKGARWSVGGVGFLLFISLLFPQNLFGFLAGLGFALILLGISQKGNDGVNAFFLNFLAIQCSLDGLFSFKDLLYYALHQPDVKTDAQAMADSTGIPAVVWAFFWGGIALVWMGWILYRLYFKKTPL